MNHDGWLGPRRADGRLTFAIRVLFAALEGGQQILNDANHDGCSRQEVGQQQLKDANHAGCRGPGCADGRLKFTIRVLFTALGVVISS